MSEAPVGTWLELNETLMSCGLEEAFDLYRREAKGPQRRAFLKRIQSRIVKLRSEAERLSIEEGRFVIYDRFRVLGVRHGHPQAAQEAPHD